MNHLESPPFGNGIFGELSYQDNHQTKSRPILLELRFTSLGSFQREQDLQGLLSDMKGVCAVNFGEAGGFVLFDHAAIPHDCILQVLKKAGFHPASCRDYDGLIP